MEEPWLRGPVEGYVAGLQPFAHELLFAKEELTAMFDKLSDDVVWQTPSGLASIGYHIRHCSGSTLRMLTYAAGNALSEEQFVAYNAEQQPDPSISKDALFRIAMDAIDAALAFGKGLSDEELNRACVVGRKKLPSNVRGLLYEIALHTSRHVGQIATTTKLLASR